MHQNTARYWAYTNRYATFGGVAWVSTSLATAACTRFTEPQSARLRRSGSSSLSTGSGVSISSGACGALIASSLVAVTMADACFCARPSCACQTGVRVNGRRGSMRFTLNIEARP